MSKSGCKKTADVLVHEIGDITRFGSYMVDNATSKLIKGD